MIHDRDGNFVRLHLEPEAARRLATWLYAGEPGRHGQGAPPEDLAPVVERFLARGYALAEETDEASLPRAALSQATVGVEGSGPVATALGSLLRDGGVGRVESFAGTPPADTDLLVSCRDWPGDRHWQELESWCRRHGAGLHLTCREGDRHAVGPLWLPEREESPTWSDTRARRLAAALFADELESWWAFLEDEGNAAPPTPPPPDTATAHLVAGVLAADVLAALAGRRPPTLGYQLLLDPATLDWSRHPVLPVPRGLLTEALP